jgi:hypothetical protein
MKDRRLIVFIPLGVLCVILCYWVLIMSGSARWHYAAIGQVPIRIDTFNGRVEAWDGTDWMTVGREAKAPAARPTPVLSKEDIQAAIADAKREIWPERYPAAAPSPSATPLPDDYAPTLQELGAVPIGRPTKHR